LAWTNGPTRPNWPNREIRPRADALFYLSEQSVENFAGLGEELEEYLANLGQLRFSPTTSEKWEDQVKLGGHCDNATTETARDANATTLLDCGRIPGRPFR
jgi:hypothetical protein